MFGLLDLNYQRTMTIRHVVDFEDRLVISTCSGEVSRDQIVESFVSLRSNRNFRPHFRQFWDLSSVSHLRLGFNDIEAIHRLYDPFSNRGKRAIVAPGNEALFGLARMYQFIIDDANFEVFHSRLEAIAWLGLEVAKIEGAMRQASQPDISAPEISVKSKCSK